MDGADFVESARVSGMKLARDIRDKPNGRVFSISFGGAAWRQPVQPPPAANVHDYRTCFQDQ
jgi:hypothetical protein